MDDGDDLLYRRRGTAGLILRLFEAELITRTVEALRDEQKVTFVQPHPILIETIDFSLVLDAFRTLTPGQRVVYLAMACAVIRTGPTRWAQRTHPANGRPHRYSEEEVARHYRMGEATVYRAWMEAQNRMGRALREVERQMRARE
jgi:hypothetical protein